MEDVDDSVRQEAIVCLCNLINLFDSELVAQEALPRLEDLMKEADTKIHDRLVKHSGQVLNSIGVDLVKEKAPSFLAALVNLLKEHTKSGEE